MYHKILVAYDGSAGSEAALDHGIEMAKSSGNLLWLVSVTTGPHDPASPHKEADRELDRAFAQVTHTQDIATQKAEKAGITLHTEQFIGNVAKTIVEHAAGGEFDLLVIGQSGHSGVWGTFLGTTADKVVRHAPCSVLVVRPGKAS